MKLDKICLYCKYLNLFTGDYGYSEYTPGYGGHIECIKGKWKLDLYEDDTKTFRRKLMLAYACKDFEITDMPWLFEKVEFEKPKG